MNTFNPVNPALVDVVLPPSGYPDDKAAGDTEAAMKFAAGETSRAFPDSFWIEPEDWADKARDNDTHHTWGMNYLDRYTNQDPTHECTCHSLRANMEAARNRHLGIIFPDGPKKDYRYDESTRGSVWLSPLSVYAEANPGQWGGAGVRQVLEIAVRRGMLPEKIQPHEYNFKHTLQGTTGKGGKNQSKGPWVKLRDFPDNWEETAKLFIPKEIIFPDSYEQAVCLVLHGHIYSVGRNQHAVPWSFWNVKERAMGYPDSYDVTRYDSERIAKNAWRGGFAIATVTTPDDWQNPAQ